MTIGTGGRLHQQIAQIVARTSQFFQQFRTRIARIRRDPPFLPVANDIRPFRKGQHQLHRIVVIDGNLVNVFQLPTFQDIQVYLRRPQIFVT